MRKSLIAAILATTAMATPALAHDDSWYIEADGGVVFMDDLNFDLDHASTPFSLPSGARVATLDTKHGFDFGGMFGYDFGPFRLEAEASYRRADANAMVVNQGQGFFPSSPATGRASALSFMVNGLVDLGPDDGPQVFAGGGVGYAHVQVNAFTSPNSTTDFAVDGADDGFAWQLLAGLRYPLSDHVDIGLKYRYYNQGSVNLPASYTTARSVSVESVGPRAVVGGTTYSDVVTTKMRSHSAMLTLSYNFLPPPPPPVEAVEVAPPEPVPVPPPPPPPTPPQIPACRTGPFIVFFDWNSAEITPEAAAILDNALTVYGQCPQLSIMLAGYTDRSGSATYNQALSQRRNASVTSYLTAHGVTAGAISGTGFGETNNRLPTADGVKELQNRRVEVTYGPGSGM